jgi:hypothetical protein
MTIGVSFNQNIYAISGSGYLVYCPYTLHLNALLYSGSIPFHIDSICSFRDLIPVLRKLDLI